MATSKEERELLGLLPDSTGHLIKGISGKEHLASLQQTGLPEGIDLLIVEDLITKDHINIDHRVILI